jgi:hypothetical protein
MFTWMRWPAPTRLRAAILGFGLALAIHLLSFFAGRLLLLLPATVFIYCIMFVPSIVAGSRASWRWWEAASPPLPEPVSPAIAWVRTHLAVSYTLVIGVWCLAPLWVYVAYWANLGPTYEQQQVLILRALSALFMGLYLLFGLDIIKRRQPTPAAN